MDTTLVNDSANLLLSHSSEVIATILVLALYKAAQFLKRRFINGKG